jgi:chromosome segregation ATPase
MISLEQVRTLEDRVEKAVAYIASLREDNAEFERRYAELERRLAEAQSFIDDAAKELAAAEEKAQAAEKRVADAEKRAEAAEAGRQGDAAATAGRIREVDARLGDMAERVAAAETRAAELSSKAEEYRKDQAKIEEGIVHALEKLDSFEDLVLSQSPANPEATPPQGASKLREPPKPEAAVQSVESVDPVDESGIAVKSGPPSQAAAEEAPTVENELDIF